MACSQAVQDTLHLATPKSLTLMREYSNLPSQSFCLHSSLACCFLFPFLTVYDEKVIK